MSGTEVGGRCASATPCPVPTHECVVLPALLEVCIVLRACYAKSGTDEGVTCKPAHDSVQAQGEAQGDAAAKVAARAGQLSGYALAMRCPVLTERVYALAMRCPVLTQRIAMSVCMLKVLMRCPALTHGPLDHGPEGGARERARAREVGGDVGQQYRAYGVACSLPPFAAAMAYAVLTRRMLLRGGGSSMKPSTAMRRGSETFSRYQGCLGTVARYGGSSASTDVGVSLVATRALTWESGPMHARKRNDLDCHASTDMGSNGTEMRARWCQVESAMRLRPRYAKSGTDLAYGAVGGG
eukprot:1839913-Rhodomonas_salina.2